MHRNLGAVPFDMATEAQRVKVVYTYLNGKIYVGLERRYRASHGWPASRSRLGSPLRRPTGQDRTQQAAETRQAQLEASRPDVIVTIEPSGANRHLFDLVVKNVGQRPALNASITLDPSPVRASEAQGHELAEARMLSEPVAMIAPGQECGLL